ncbi:MAG: hypothetical protein HY873_09305 [Chloroflexi bacterium]|nr:hypothetical protein [Chloroflexota bacterium]
MLTMIVALLMVGGARRPQVAAAAPGDIATYAGGGVGDGGGATEAAVSPYGVAADGAGNLYIADSANCRVRMLTPGGAISTVAGMGACGYAGDGGPATGARLNLPQAVAVDSAGNLFIADTQNCRIRKVDTVGTITTFAGSGTCIFAGEGAPATIASLANPRGVAVNAAGDVYIADSDNCRVRKVSGGIITTFAGTGSCGFLGDGGQAVSAGITHASGVWDDGGGNVYIADTDSCRVRVVTPSGVISTVAGNGTCAYTGDGGLAYSTGINKPRAIATDTAGDLYIADTDNCRVRKVTYPSVTISTVTGDGDCNYGGDGGPAASGKVNHPQGVAIVGGDVYVGDSGNCRLRRASGGGITSIAGTGWCQFGGDGGPATNASLSDPGGVAKDSAGNLYIADAGNCRIRKVTAAGVISTFAGNGSCLYGGDGGPPLSASFDHPRGVTVDGTGAVYVADTDACRVRKIAGGAVSTVAGDGVCGFGGDGGSATAAQLSFPQAIAISGSTLYVADTFNCRVRRISGGVITTHAGDGGCGYDGDGGPPLSASLTFPYGVAADAGGVYIADTYNCRVRKVAGGVITTIAGTGTCAYGGDGGAATSAAVNRPTGIAVAAGGAVYVADTDNCRVRLISGETMITVTGLGTGVSFAGCGYDGDGGPAAAAAIDRPAGIAVDPSGSLFIADSFNDRMRIVSPGEDGDGDGVADAGDNCPSIVNADQLNSDRNFVSNAPLYGSNDLTWIVSDNAGDACDGDDDNDGISDAAEPAGCLGSGPLDPVKRDTDGDRRLDYAECALGSNPADAGSFPPAIVAPDADSDGLPDSLDPNDASQDTDGDGVKDGVEFRNYNSNVTGVNTDGDTCADGKEVASLNADTSVNAGDQLLLVLEISRVPPPAKLVNFDMNKDGVVNAGDQLFQVLRFGAC